MSLPYLHWNYGIILDPMLKDFTKLVLTAKAAVDIVKEKIGSKACDLAMQVKNFRDKTQSSVPADGQPQCKIKEKAKEELFNIIGEITHRAQINELQLKSFIKEKLTELTNNALLDSMELNDIRAEIAGLRAELADLKSQMSLQKR